MPITYFDASYTGATRTFKWYRSRPIARSRTVRGRKRAILARRRLVGGAP